MGNSKCVGIYVDLCYGLVKHMGLTLLLTLA